MGIMWRALHHNCLNPSHAIHDALCTWDFPFRCHSPTQFVASCHSMSYMTYSAICESCTLFLFQFVWGILDGWTGPFVSTFTEKLWQATVHLVISSHPSIRLSTQNSTIPTGWTARSLTCKTPTFAYANTRKTNTHKIHFIYLGNKAIYCILRHAA
jgi:hypothetical protein